MLNKNIKHNDNFLDIMALGPNSIRTMLYGINVIFVLTGIILAAHGMDNLFFYRHYGQLIQSQYEYISYIQIVVGFATCAIAIIGWYGAMAESSVITLLFSTSLLLLFFLEMSVGVGGYFLNLTARKSLDKSLLLPNITDNYSMLYRWERLQNDFSCCGVMKASDWLGHFGDDENEMSLPESCCYYNAYSWEEGWNVVGKCWPRDAYKVGCLAPLEAEIQDNSIMVSLICFTIGTFQLLGICMTCFLSGEFRKGYHSI